MLKGYVRQSTRKIDYHILLKILDMFLKPSLYCRGIALYGLYCKQIITIMLWIGLGKSS